MRAVGIGLLLALCGCFGEEALENAACDVDADCASTQECVRTQFQLDFTFPGWCRPEGEGCAKGQQPGCACKPADVRFECESAAVGPSDASDPSCLCCPRSETNTEVLVDDNGQCLAEPVGTGSSGG